MLCLPRRQRGRRRARGALFEIIKESTIGVRLLISRYIVRRVSLDIGPLLSATTVSKITPRASRTKNDPRTISRPGEENKAAREFPLISVPRALSSRRRIDLRSPWPRSISRRLLCVVASPPRAPRRILRRFSICLSKIGTARVVA